MKKNKVKTVDKKQAIVSVFKKFVEKHHRYPNTVELTELGYSRAAVRHHFGSISKLKSEIKVKFPEVVKAHVASTLFDPKKFKQIEDYIKGANRFVITTAVTDTLVHTNFLKAMKSYCGINKATLLILPCSDKSFNEDSMLDPSLAKECIITNDVSLNKNIHIRLLQLSARMIDPATGLDRLSQRDGAFLYPSTKQRLKFVANSANKLPHPIMTPGAVTIPEYEDSNYMSKRTSYIAKNDHVLGAIIVELSPDNKYFFRQIQADPKTGSFIDLGTTYLANGSTKDVDVEALVMGDYHVGETNAEAKEVFREVCKELTIKNLVLHDLFNGRFHNHHDAFKTITRAKLAESNKISLEDELSMVNTELNDLSTWVKNRVIVVKSNHDEVVSRYLQEARYVNDPINLRMASQLICPMIDSIDPLVYGLKNLTTLSNKKVAKLANVDKILFLERDESFKIAGIELGVHGDIGANGSRGGNLANFEKAYGACVVGHSHTAEIQRASWRVGTTSEMRPDYASGASSWTHTGCLVYANGSRQLIHNIGGQWRLK